MLLNYIGLLKGSTLATRTVVLGVHVIISSLVFNAVSIVGVIGWGRGWGMELSAPSPPARELHVLRQGRTCGKNKLETERTAIIWNFFPYVIGWQAGNMACLDRLPSRSHRHPWEKNIEPKLQTSHSCFSLVKVVALMSLVTVLHWSGVKNVQQ